MADVMPPQTPAHVLDCLNIAFEEGCVGETDCTQGHNVESRIGVIKSEAGEANLLYGELLPEAISQSLTDLGLFAHREGGGAVLELGMGTGKVAFQAFLECRSVHRVVGVEISAARFEIAAASADRLATAQPELFAAWQADAAGIAELLQDEGSAVLRGHVLQERASDRQLWLLEGDLGALASPRGPIRDARAIYLQLRLPASARVRAYSLLQGAPDGCRVFSLDNLSWEWILDEPSVLHAVGEGVVTGDRDLYATSWCPKGYPFCVFEADRSRKPTITVESAVSAVQDLYAQAFF